MTCQHCQTWILDDDHRCSRCGRRVRSTPSRVSPNTFPIAATATAPAYDFDHSPEVNAAPEVDAGGQTQLFAVPVNEPRVIALDSRMTQAERDSIRTRAAEVQRPAPVRTARVEVRRPRQRKADSLNQRRLEFEGQQEVLAPSESNIICDAQVAPVMARVQAAAVDGLMMLVAYLAPSALFWFEGGFITSDKHALPFLALALATVPILYKLLWVMAGRDSFGMQCTGIRLVDFDGNPPSRERRYQRLLGGFLSLLAAGVGLIWALVDADRLTWHDHISSTFPTLD